MTISVVMQTSMVILLMQNFLPGEMCIRDRGNDAHGNQPIQHMIYLYNYSSQPWKAQYWLREVMAQMCIRDRP